MVLFKVFKLVGSPSQVCGWEKVAEAGMAVDEDEERTTLSINSLR